MHVCLYIASAGSLKRTINREHGYSWIIKTLYLSTLPPSHLPLTQFLPLAVSQLSLSPHAPPSLPYQYFLFSFCNIYPFSVLSYFIYFMLLLFTAFLSDTSEYLIGSEGEGHLRSMEPVLSSEVFIIDWGCIISVFLVVGVQADSWLKTLPQCCFS